MTDHDTATDRDSMAARRRQDGEIVDLTLACTLFQQVVADQEAQLGQALADIAAHEERETELSAQLSQAIEDNACLLTILRELDYHDPAQAQRLLDKVRGQEHPGRSLMAWLTRRHYAAQELADVLRLYVRRETASLPIDKADTVALGRILDALAAYDAALKARQS